MERVDVLAARIERLERQNAGLRRGGAAGFVIAAGVLLTALAPAVPAEVKTRRLVLVDQSGAARGALSTTADGAPMLVLSDAAGRPRLVAAVTAQETTLTLKDDSTESAVVLRAAGDASRLAVADAQGIDRLWATVRLGSPALQFFNTKRVASSGLATFNDDAGVAVMSGSTGPSDPGIALFGKKPGVLWSAPN